MSNNTLRNIAAKFIERRFLNKALIPLKWCIKHESDFTCLITIINILKRINNYESKLLLFNEVKKIINIMYLNKEKKIKNKRFKKVIQNLLNTKKFEDFTSEELSQILINFCTIKHLIKLFPNVFYELDSQNGLVKELDLSDFLEYEVRGIPWGWKNDITSLSEVNGLKYLNNLTKINLSNNQIKNIKSLVNLVNLTHLILTNNKISELKNLEYIKKLPNLEYLDLRYNEIVRKIDPNRFNQTIRVLLSDYLVVK
ncbi:MAG: leucine-rich repeat domain-containing protein [Promethearchaeota archaeon]